jgi:four helix bundle protein
VQGARGAGEIGIRLARRPHMGARTYRDLEAWKLADQLRREIIALTATPHVAQDRKFCDEIRSASGSICRNLAEGFCRYHHREFAQFLRIALGSVGEMQDLLQETFQRRFIEKVEFDRLWMLSERTKAASTKLLTYLRSHPRDPSPRT